MAATLRTILLALTLLPLWSLAQDTYHATLLNQLQNDYGLTGSNWVLTSNEGTNISNAIKYGINFQQTTISGQDFDAVAQMTVPGTGSNPWDAGYFNANVNTVQAGDKVLLVLWLRAAPGGIVPGKINIFVENSTTYFKEVQLTVNPQSAWLQYLIPFESTATYTASQLNTGFHLAYQQQVIEMGGMTLLNYGNSVSLSQLPSQLNNEYYPGSEPNAPWRAQAASRIEQHRKADMVIRIQDDQGNPIPNTPVRVEMLRHAFAFGTAVTPRRLAGNSLNDPTYQSKLTNLDGKGHGFNWVVTENALKWRAWEQGWAGTPAETVKGIQWLTDRNIKVRGHVLVWPGWDFMPPDMQNNASNPTYLRNRIDGRLDEILNYPGVRGKVQEWDFINEIAHERDLENAFSGKPGYTTGREIYPEIIAQAYSEDASLISYINDYNILSNGSVLGGDYVLFKSMLDEIVGAGSHLDGIGFQAHMGGALVAPDSLYAILEDCYQIYGKDIKITEYDQADIISDSLSAKYTGDFLTMIFSHPAVNGFMMWGFWDGAHWHNHAPLYEQNWDPKPTHATFVDLVFTQWWTDSTVTTDANGELVLRGFKGDYQITTSHDSVDWIAELSVGQNLDTTLVLSMVGLADQLDPALIKVYPNPAQNILVVELPQLDNWTLSLVDLLGKQVAQQDVLGLTQKMNVQDYPAGIYYLRISNARGEWLVKKVMIAK